MPDTTAEFVVTPGGNPFSELDLLFPGYFNPGFYGGDTPAPVDAGTGGDYTLPETPPDEAFAPPPPVLLPEFEVKPPPRPVTTPVPIETPGIVGSLLTGLVLLLFPVSTGPAEYDEAPTPPPPPKKPPGGTDPIMPPNWNDLAHEPFEVTRPGPPLTPLPMTPIAPPVEMPFGEEFFDVSPPGVSPNPFTGFPDVLRVPFITPEPITADPFDFPLEVFPDVRTDTGSRPAPSPTSTPRSNPLPSDPFSFPDPWIGPAVPLPEVTPTPDILGDPLPDVIGDPFGVPGPAPREPAAPRRDPTGTGGPLPFVTTPFDDPPGLIDPLAEFGPLPTKPDNETCSCAKKPKEKKKQKDREECWRGTYIQRSRGISYIRKEKVPCESSSAAKKTSSSRSSSSPSPRKARKKKTPPGMFPGLPVPSKKRKKKTRLPVLF